MKNISKYKLDKSIVIPILLFALISVFTLLGADSILPSTMDNLVSKQIIWYAIGMFLAYIIMTIGNNFIYQIVWILYGIGVLSLAGVFSEGFSFAALPCFFGLFNESEELDKFPKSSSDVGVSFVVLICVTCFAFSSSALLASAEEGTSASERTSAIRRVKTRLPRPH